MSRQAPEYRRERSLSFLFVLFVLAVVARAENPTPWRNYVGTCLDTLLTHGTDRYGGTSSDMFVAILDVDTLNCPETPEWLDSEAYYEEGRSHRRSMAGANFWYDQETIRSMYRLSTLTGDGQYAAGANRAINAFYDNAVRADTGMPIWGSHTFYNVFTDQRDGDPAGYHETLVYDAQWSRLYNQRPTETTAVIDNMWDRHVVNKITGQFNRHDNGASGCDFAFAGGSLISAFATMYNQTRDPVYLQRAKTVENWHWSQRDPTTNLVADAPGLSGVRYDGDHCFTTVTGPYAWQLMNAYEQTGDADFLDHAATYIKAYEQYGWDDQAETYWAMLQMDGTPVVDPLQGGGYDIWAPTGHVDLWKTTIYSYEFPLLAAQSAIRAYELTGDADLLVAAEHWAATIELQLPVQLGERFGDALLAAMPELAETDGSYAEDYGRTISFYVHLYEATGDEDYLALAEQVAQDAVEKLYVNGIFRGHVAKPYYEATNGVGVLLDSLLELDAAVQAPEPATMGLLAIGGLGLLIRGKR
ncbi:MAG: PEP-CTERM sorting domain-containing protein [Phycisphaerae bacterium]|nr:PEP-CTERM sorting domain-containing protein [Phycisphaerae bacterium]